jgi:hypothetical protein
MWRYSVDFEKEEDWLNEQVAKGLALTHFAFGRYTFEECVPGEYIYRLELLEHSPGHSESISYLSFLAEQGVEYICPWNRWVYLRKKTSDGPFDIYSDLDSRLTHYQRINTLLTPVMYLELIIGLINLLIVLFGSAAQNHLKTLNLIAGGLCLLVGLVIYIGCRPLKRKIKQLRLEKNLRE